MTGKLTDWNMPLNIEKKLKITASQVSCPQLCSCTWRYTWIVLRKNKAVWITFPSGVKRRKKSF